MTEELSHAKSWTQLRGEPQRGTGAAQGQQLIEWPAWCMTKTETIFNPVSGAKDGKERTKSCDLKKGFAAVLLFFSEKGEAKVQPPAKDAGWKQAR